MRLKTDQTCFLLRGTVHFYTLIIWRNQFFQRKENFCIKYLFNPVANELIGFPNCWRLQKSFETLDFPLRGVHHSNPRKTIDHESILNQVYEYVIAPERRGGWSQRLEQHRGGENEFIFKLDSRRIRPRVNERAKCLWYDWYLRERSEVRRHSWRSTRGMARGREVNGQGESFACEGGRRNTITHPLSHYRPRRPQQLNWQL